MNYLLISCVLFSSVTFMGYSISYFTSSHMKTEFERFKLKKFGLFVIILEILGAFGLYSVEPNFNRIYKNWFLILINARNKTIYVFNIPSNHAVYDKLYKRDDKDVYRLLFNVDDSYFTEKFSHVSFDQFLVGECRYEDDSSIFN